MRMRGGGWRCICVGSWGVQVERDRGDYGSGEVFDGEFGEFGDGGEDKKGSASGTQGQAD